MSKPKGWSCRPCARNEHGKCWEETNGVFCVCTHDASTRYERQAANRCDTCDYVLTELNSIRRCINHSCPAFGIDLIGAADE